MSHRHEGARPPRRQITAHTVQLTVKIFRDLAIFILGAYGFIHELAREGAERPQLLILTAAMMGLPLIIRGDEKRQEVKADDTNEKGGP